MTRLRQPTTCLLIFCFASLAISDEPDWFKTDSSEQLEAIITEFRANYELLRLERRAFVCEGTKLSRRKDRIEIADIRFVSCFDKDLVFRANSYLGKQRNREGWSQKLLYQGKLHQRFGPFNADIGETIDDDEKIKEANKTTQLFSPIDNAILPARFASGLTPHTPAHAKLTVGKLVSGEFGPDGIIVQKIRRDGGIRPVQDEFVWSRVKGTDLFFPIRYEFFYVEDDGRLRRGSIVKTEWKKIGDLIVPSAMTFVQIRSRYSLEINLSVEYLFGDKIGTSPVVEPSMKDWREPIRVLFGKEWLRRGGPIPLSRALDVQTPKPGEE